MRTKNQIAQREYGLEFDRLEPAEKAAVTRKFNAQTSEPAVVRAPTQTATPAGSIKATIGRVGVNGSKTCLLPVGSTVKNLVDQAGFSLDDKKEGVIAESTGLAVKYTDAVVHNETYAITVGVSSA